MADTFLEEATSVKENDPYEVAAAGQVLTADGIGGVGWQPPALRLILVETPPFVQGLPSVKVLDDLPPDGTHTLNIGDHFLGRDTPVKVAWFNLVAGNSNVGTAQVYIRLHGNEEHEGVICGVTLQEGVSASVVGIPVPLHEGNFDVEIIALSGDPYITVDVTYIFGMG